MKANELVRCPACGGPDAESFALGEHRLRRCAACGLVYAPEYGEPEEIYVDGYFTGGTDFGLDVMHPRFQRYLATAAARRLDVLERIVGTSPSMLDVGCGTGEVLAAAAARGWKAVGVEPVAESAAIARDRGLDVHNAFLEDSGLPQRSFDIVSAFHVLEHMTDGVSFLRSISRWARPGGHLVLECPNYRSFHRRNHGDRWPHLRPLEHVAHYEPKTIAATLRRAGLEPVKVRTLSFLWDGQTLDQALTDLGALHHRRWINLLARDETRDGQLRRVPGRSGWAVLHAMNRAYDLANVGQVVFAVAKVP